MKLNLRDKNRKRVGHRLVLPFFAALIVLSNVLACLVVPGKASAVGSPQVSFRTIVPKFDGGYVNDIKDETITCAATLNNQAPVSFFTGNGANDPSNSYREQNTASQVSDSGFGNGVTSPSYISSADAIAAAKLFKSTQPSNGQTLKFKTITFSGSADCNTLILVQSAPGSSRFYGLMSAGAYLNSAGGGSGWELALIETTLGSDGSFSFKNPVSSGNLQDISNEKSAPTVGPFALNGYKTIGLGAPAGGTIGDANGCVKLYSEISSAQQISGSTAYCNLDIGGDHTEAQNKFVDFATICFGGETFVLDGWKGDGSKNSDDNYYVKYSLRSTFDARCGKEIDHNWYGSSSKHSFIEIAALDIPGHDNLALTLFKNNLAEYSKEGVIRSFVLQIENGHGSFRVDSPPMLHINTTDTASASGSGLRTVATYYGANATKASPNTISIIATNPGDHEKLYDGTYVLEPGTTSGTGKYIFKNQSVGGICAGNDQVPYFTNFSKSLTKAHAGDIITADWVLTDNTDKSCSANVKISGITIRVATASEATPPVSTSQTPTAAQCAAKPTLAGCSVQSSPSCESSAGALGWIICPVIDGLQYAVGGIYDNIIQPLLETDSLSTKSNDPIFKTWSVFRTYGDIFLIIALLVVVFGESIGGGLIDAYTAKKILPRILVTAVLINISYYLVAIMVDVTNIVGKGIANLITTPFSLSGDFTIQIGKTGTTTLTAGLLYAIAWGALTVSGSFIAWLWVAVILPMLLIFLAIMVVVILRGALIVFLVIISPVAFALYCLPNTEKYFRQWWDTLFKTLLVYPVIAVLFALGKVFSYIISHKNGNFITGTVADIMAVVALVVPLVLIPFAFQLAGGILGRMHDVVNGGRQKLHARGEERRANAKANMSRVQAGRKAAFSNKVVNSTVGKKLQAVPLAGKHFGASAASAEQKVSRANADLMRNPGMAPVANDGYALLAATYGSHAKAVEGLQRDHGLTAEKAREAANRWQGTGMGWSQSAGIAAFQAAVADGTVFKNGKDQKATIARLTGNNESLRARVWGSAYAGNKAAGRYDLSEGYGDGLNKITRMVGGTASDGTTGPVTDAEHAQAAVEGIRGVSNTELSRIKGMGMTNASDSLLTVMNEAAVNLQDPNLGLGNNAGLDSSATPEEVTQRLTQRRQKIETQRAEAVTKLLNLRDSGAYLPENTLKILESAGTTYTARTAVDQVSRQVATTSVEDALIDRVAGDAANQQDRADDAHNGPATRTVSAERPRGRTAYDPNQDPANNQNPPQPPAPGNP